MSEALNNLFLDFDCEEGERQSRLVELASRQLPPAIAERWVLDTCLGKGGAAFAFFASERGSLNGSSPPVVVRYLHKANPASVQEGLDARCQGPRHSQFAFPESDLVQGPSGVWFHAMSYIPGKTLFSLFRGDLSNDYNRLLQRAYTLALDLTDAVAWLERHGIVHRDLKPSNLTEMPTGELGVFDFDLARPHGFIPLVNAFRGTPRYAAPELLEGHLPLDSRCDLYSVGVSVLERLRLLPVLGLARHDHRALLQDKLAGVTSTDSLDRQFFLRRVLSSDVDESLRDTARRLGDWLVAVLRHQPDSRPFPAEANDILTSDGSAVHYYGPVDTSQKHPVLGEHFECEGMKMKILKEHESDGSHWWDVQLEHGVFKDLPMVLRRFNRSLEEGQLFPAEFRVLHLPIFLPFFGGGTCRITTPEGVGDYKLWFPAPGISLARDRLYQTGEVSLLAHHDRCMRTLADTLKCLSQQRISFDGLRWEDLTTRGGINVFRPGVSMRVADDVEDALLCNLFFLAKAIAVGFCPPEERGLLMGIKDYDFVTSEQKFLHHYSGHPEAVTVIRRLFGFLKRVHSIGWESFIHDWQEFWDSHDRAELERTFDLLKGL